jgi:hypothetical protein
LRGNPKLLLERRGEHLLVVAAVTQSLHFTLVVVNGLIPFEVILAFECNRGGILLLPLANDAPLVRRLLLPQLAVPVLVQRMCRK